MTYQVIITENFSKLLNHYINNLSKISDKKSFTSKLLIDYIKKGEIKFEPVFPGLTDSQMSRYYKIHLSKEISGDDLKKLKTDPAFESFYQKPEDELPIK